MIRIVEIKNTQENGTPEVKNKPTARLRNKAKRAAEQRRRRRLEKRTSAWSWSLEMVGGASGLVGSAGVPLLRLLTEETALRGQLSKALAKAGFVPGHDRGQVLIDVAIGLALGATSVAETMRQIEQGGAVLGTTASAVTAWRMFDEELDATALAKVARARAAHRRWIWQQLAFRPQGFPWVEVAGQIWDGWIVLDVDASLVECHSDKEGAAPTYKKHIFGLHPLIVTIANTGEMIVIYLRKGNAGSVRHEVAQREWTPRRRFDVMSKV
jgi:hypothetical protein